MTPSKLKSPTALTSDFPFESDLRLRIVQDLLQYHRDTDIIKIVEESAILYDYIVNGSVPAPKPES